MRCDLLFCISRVRQEYTTKNRQTKNKTKQTRTKNQKKKTQWKQRQKFIQIGTQLPLTGDTFISHSVYKCCGNVSCKIVNALC